MATYCQGCIKLAEHEYWNRCTNQQFFKFMLNDFHHHLRIPRTFVEHFNGKLLGWYSLKGPSGNKWVVNVKNTNNDTLFLDGWDKFVRDHGLKPGYLLVFCYVGESEFKVTIFSGTSSCEVETSHFVNNIQSPSSSYKTCVSSFHGIVSYGSECDDDGGGGGGGGGDDDDDDERCPSVKEEFDMHGNDGDGYGDGDDDDGDDDDDDGDDDDDDDYVEEEEVVYDKKGKRVRSFKPRTASVKQRHICFKSNRRQVTTAEKRKAEQLALEYMMRNENNGPRMFQVILLPSHVYSIFHLTIPKKWAKKHMHGEPHEVELVVPGVRGRWLVGCWWSPLGQCKFITRWQEFVKDNILEENDICVFELVKTRNITLGHSGYPRFLVRIFRVVDNPIPFTQTRRYL